MENEYKNWSREELIEELIDYKDIVEMLENAVQGGVGRFSLKDMHIINATKGYYRMTGYTQEESLAPPFLNCGLNLVIPEDLKIMEKAIDTLINKNEAIHVDYRIRKKDGSTVWNSAFCSGVQGDEQDPHIDVFFLDITQERERQNQNLINEERFRIISEHTKDVIFEWDIKTNTFNYSSVFEKVYGVKPPTNADELIASNLIYEADIPIVEKIMADMRSGIPNVEFKVRLKSADGSYYWALHRATIIQYENDKPSLVIGIISNITEFVENALVLQHKAEHDALTGLLNREVAERLIQFNLENAQQHAHYAFVQFDLDRFKQINDFMGHAAGDLALKEIACQMQKMFRSDDILVRMGGDEFAIFLLNCPNKKALKKRLDSFRQSIYSDFEFEEKIYPLSISMGIACYPDDGKTFQELYENADIALYRAKRSGGNTLKFFSKS